MPRIGVTELILILVIILVIFGVGKMPQIGGAIGRGMREFRRAQHDEDEVSGPQKAASAPGQVKK